jgi:hypothetical protein
MKKLIIIVAVVFITVFVTSCEKQEIILSESANAPQVSQTFIAESPWRKRFNKPESNLRKK